MFFCAIYKYSYLLTYLLTYLAKKVQLTLIGSPQRAFDVPKMIIVRCP